jgi:hypothetical protein
MILQLDKKTEICSVYEKMHLPLNIKSASSEAMLGTATKLKHQQLPLKMQ